MLRLVISILLFVSQCFCAKILAVFPTPSFSHQIVYQPIWQELSLRGHEVTVLTPSPLNNPSLSNLTEIDLSESYKIFENYGIDSLGSEGHSSKNEVQKLFDTFMAVSEFQLSHPRVQEIIKGNHSFDLFLVEFLVPTMYGFKDILDCPMIGVTSIGLTQGGYMSLGQPNNPATDPDISLPFSRDLTFKERIISTCYKIMYNIIFSIDLKPKMDKLMKKYFGDVRGSGEIAKETDLVIVNSNWAIRDVKPLIPSVVEISGIHLKPKKPLPMDLKNILDDSKNGVIYFSLGSNVKSNLLSKEKLQMLINVISRLPYTVLWKFENENLPQQPKNLHIRTWFPQQDLLGHPNVKLFINQGGLQSLDESIYNKVPMLIIPFFGDQRHNSQHLVSKKAAVSIDFLTMTEEELETKIYEVIKNPKYKQRVIELSAIAYDHLTPPLEKAIWWIEYVLRHNGAKHLRYSGRDMPFYQFFLLDVIAFLGVSFCVTGFILFKLSKWTIAVLLSLISLRKSSKQHTE